jgi:thiosulfate/3-mercaptopyruvate sulfurtransferase
VPGHGTIPTDPAALVQQTRAYVTGLRADMRKAAEQNIPMQRALAALPPPDQGRPISLNSRKRRNALRVYLEMEREAMGLGPDSGTVAAPAAATSPGASLPAAPLPAVPPPARLVSTDSLAAWQRRGDVLLVDVRLDPFIYLKSHLPGAVYLNSETLRAADHGVPMQLLSQDQYRQLLSRLGIRWDRPVVVYSAGESRNIDATFLVWILQSLGHRQVFLLDGGFFKWQLEQRPMAAHYPKLVPAPPAHQSFRPPRASLDDVRRALETRSAVLVDARPPDQFAGEAGAQMRRGHIPGAINHYWQDDLQQEGFGHVWKPLGELRQSYARQGITPDKDLILYCNSTTEASHVYFALRNLLNYPRVRIYSGSWTEWAEREELPIETGPAR